AERHDASRCRRRQSTKKERTMSAPDRLRTLLSDSGFVVMPAVWDGLSAKLAAAAGYPTAFLSGSCVAASRLGGPDLDLVSVAAASGKPSFSVLTPGAPLAVPTREQAAALGFKIGTYPTAMLSPAISGMKAGLAALVAGEAEASVALPPAELRATLGYGDYDV